MSLWLTGHHSAARTALPLWETALPLLEQEAILLLPRSTLSSLDSMDNYICFHALLNQSGISLTTP